MAKHCLEYLPKYFLYHPSALLHVVYINARTSWARGLFSLLERFKHFANSFQVVVKLNRKLVLELAHFMFGVFR